MPERPERLYRRSEFRRVAARGRKCATPGLVLQVAARPGPDSGMRYGLTASRKVGKAVTRNRARRRLRALAESELPRQAEPGYDYVLIARAETPSRRFDALRGDLLAALSKVGARRRGGARAGDETNATMESEAV